MVSSSTHAWYSVFGISILVSLALHGCGGGGGGATTTTATTTTTTTATTTTATTATTTTTTTASQSFVINQLNHDYMAYDDSTGAGPYGVTVRFLRPIDSEIKEWYHCGGACYQGWAKCRASSAIINHKVMTNNSKVIQVLGDPIGLVFNQTAVETQLAKCMYAYDGGTQTRYNGGCGCSPDTSIIDKCKTDCSLPQCPYNSKDASGKDLTPVSTEIDRCHCKNEDDPGCYWKGPAFFKGETHDEFKEMMQARVKADKKNHTSLPWDEVIIDGNVLDTMLKDDPSSAIAAFLWMKTGDETTDKTNYGFGQHMVELMKGNYPNLRSPYLIAMDQTQDVTKAGPFKTSEEALAYTVSYV